MKMNIHSMIVQKLPGEEDILDEADIAEDISPKNITHINRIPVDIFLDDSPHGASFDIKGRNFRYNE